MTSWDTTIALSYAAEELLVAAQALTTDLMSRQDGIIVAHAHLRILMKHQHSLPSAIGDEVAQLDAVYARQADSNAADQERADSLTIATMAVLGGVRDALTVEQERRIA
jgi:hypothetical protein